MIFVTVGEATRGFPRLLEAVERLAREGCFGSEDIIMQVGHTKTFRSTRAVVSPFFPPGTFDCLLRDARIVISHGGCGTILSALRVGKIPVVMPRRASRVEHVNDHQFQLSEALAREGAVFLAVEPKDLPSAIDAALGNLPAGALPPPTMVGVLTSVLARYAKARERD
jgi:UDP-N-acetylglucosamine transferase subunit ALG13